MSDDFDPALRVADFLDGQLALWFGRLPGAFGQAHWHIIGLVRPYGTEGIRLRRLFLHIANIFGMDDSTCKKRLRELFEEGLLTSEDTVLKSGSFIAATPDLIAKYDAYGVDLANLMVSLVYDDAAKPVVTGSGSMALNERLSTFFERLGKAGAPKVDGFLRKKIASPLLREKIEHCLQTYGYWRIVSLAWRHSYTAGGARNRHLLVDHFHMELFPRIGIGANATKEYVQNLIDWQFLERLGQADGVKGNRFAVRMTDDARDLLDGLFRDAYPILVEIGKSIAGHHASLADQDQTVVPISRAVPRNIAGTSVNEGSAESA